MGAGGGGPGASCPCLPQHSATRSLHKCLLNTACSQVLCWAWPPVLGTRGPQTPPQQGRQGREAVTAESVSPTARPQLLPLLHGLGNSSLSAFPPTSTVEGSRAGPEWGALSRLQSPCPQGSALGKFVAWGPLCQKVARRHTHRFPSRPLSSDSRSPRSSSGNGQLQASSAGGRASSSSWVSAEGLWSARGEGPASPTPEHN